MIEEVVRNYLKEKMGVPVYTEEPESPPESYVLIEKTAGGYSEHLNRATFAVQSYGKRLADAAALNEDVKKVLLEIADQRPISKVELNTDYNFTDTETKRYRYQAVYQFIYY